MDYHHPYSGAAGYIYANEASFTLTTVQPCAERCPPVLLFRLSCGRKASSSAQGFIWPLEKFRPRESSYFCLHWKNMQFDTRAVLQELASTESLVLPPTATIASAEKKKAGSRASARVSAKSADQSWCDVERIEEQPYFSPFPLSAGAEERHHQISQWYYVTRTGRSDGKAFRWTKRIRVSPTPIFIFPVLVEAFVDDAGPSFRYLLRAAEILTNYLCP